MNILKSALWYARYGWNVIPLHSPIFTDGLLTGCTCEEYRRSEKYRQWLESKGKGYIFDPAYTCRTPGKHPHMSAWEDAATVDPEQIAKWWSWWGCSPQRIASAIETFLSLQSEPNSRVAPPKESPLRLKQNPLSFAHS